MGGFRWRLGLLAASAWLATTAAEAAVVAYGFEARVTSTFGVAGVSVGSLVQGMFSIDPESVNVGTAAQAIYLQPATTVFQFNMAGIVQDFDQTGRVDINDNFDSFDRYLACSTRPLGSVDVEDACIYFLGADLGAIEGTDDPLPPTDLADFSLIALDYRLFQDGALIGFVRANPLVLTPVQVPAPLGTSLLVTLLLAVHAAARRGWVG